MKNNFFYSLVIIFLFSLIVNFSRQIYVTWKAGRKLVDLETEILELEEKNRELRAKLEKVQGKDFIEEEAREKLGMTREGEKVIILPTIVPPNFLADTEDRPISNWRRWWKLFVYWVLAGGLTERVEQLEKNIDCRPKFFVFPLA